MAGHGYSAESWGPGRAVARIPRISGGGTHKAGSGAFGNQAKGGHMFAPNRVWRRWHVKTNKNQKRYAIASALAASSCSALVQGRGHVINQVPELPLVINTNDVQVHKTKDAINILEKFGCMDDINRSKSSKHIRAGKGKNRDRKYVMKKGPLLVYKENEGIIEAFRNLPGVELCHISRLNLLKLAPGGHVGRLLIWTSSAFERLDKIFGTRTSKSEIKGFTLPRNVLTNTDIDRIIQSDEIQGVLRMIKEGNQLSNNNTHNPLNHKDTMDKLNPFDNERKKIATTNNQKGLKAKKDKSYKKITKQKNKKNKDRKKKTKKFLNKTREEIDFYEKPEDSDVEDEEEEDDEDDME